MTNPFESFPIPQKEKEMPAIPEKIDQLSEKRKEIIGESQGKRRNLIKDIFTSRTADMAGNLIPGIDIPKMTTEAIYGKTISGEKLSSRQRFAYAAISGGITLAYALQIAGMQNEALATRSVAAVYAKMEFTPEILEIAAEKARNKFPRIASLLEKTASYFTEEKGSAISVGRGTKNTEQGMTNLAF